MRVLRQNDTCIDVKWGFYANLADSLAEYIDFAEQHVAASVEEIDGEEICTTRHAIAAVVSHPGKVASADGSGNGESSRTSQ